MVAQTVQKGNQQAVFCYRSRVPLLVLGFRLWVFPRLRAMLWCLNSCIDLHITLSPTCSDAHRSVADVTSTFHMQRTCITKISQMEHAHTSTRACVLDAKMNIQRLVRIGRPCKQLAVASSNDVQRVALPSSRLGCPTAPTVFGCCSGPEPAQATASHPASNQHCGPIQEPLSPHMHHWSFQLAPTGHRPNCKS